jgi:hypothetical protein
MQFIKGLMLSILSLTTLWLLAIALQSARPTASSQWIADAYAHKKEIAQKIQGEKIVIVAGSASLFGIDSKALEKTFNRPVVNFSVNAGLLLPYVLLKSKSILKKGDIVLMPLEYHFYTYDGTPNVQMIDQIFSRDPHFFWELSPMEQFKMLWMISPQRIVEGFQAKGTPKTMMGPYGYAHLDDHGDQTHTSKEEALQWAYDWDSLKKELPRTYAKEAHHTKGWEWLASYITWAKKEGITIIITPPTMMFDPYYLNNPKEKAFYTGIEKKVNALRTIFIGDPYNYMYDRELYFNTDYHLIDQGREYWTRQLIKDLKNKLTQKKKE